MNNSLISPAAAAFSRLVTEGGDSQAIQDACNAGLSYADAMLALSLYGEEA